MDLEPLKLIIFSDRDTCMFCACQYLFRANSRMFPAFLSSVFVQINTFSPHAHRKCSFPNSFRHSIVHTFKLNSFLWMVIVCCCECFSLAAAKYLLCWNLWSLGWSLAILLLMWIGSMWYWSEICCLHLLISRFIFQSGISSVSPTEFELLVRTHLLSSIVFYLF